MDPSTACTIRSEPLGSGFVATHKRYVPHAIVPPHAHADGTLSIPFRGRFLERVGPHEIELGGHRALYKRPDHEHDNTIGAGGFDGVLVEVDGERHRWLGEAVRARAANLCGDGPGIRAAVAGFRTAWFGDAPDRAFVLESFVLQILGEFDPRRACRPVRPRWLDAVLDALHDRFPARPTLAELATIAGVHPVHLAQTFVRHEECSVGTWVERLRMRAVCRALAGGDEPLVSIAIATGFADQSHMTRAFRRALGTTPARYRRDCRGR